MNNREKLKNLLAGIPESENNMDQAFKSAEKEIKVTMPLSSWEKARFKTISIAEKKFSDFKKQIDDILASIDILKEELKTGDKDLTTVLNEKMMTLRGAMNDQKYANAEQMRTISGQIDNLRKEIQGISQRKVEIPDFASKIGMVENNLKKLIAEAEENNKIEFDEVIADSQESIARLELEIKKLRADAMSAIASQGGGNMNRNILVGGNSSTLGRYTDLNIKSGQNITLTYVNNDNLKTTDLTIAASGGAGSGITRNISTVNVSSVIGEISSTDYVIVVGAGIQLTMPTAVGNSNLYTIKNKSTSSVLLIPNGSETIDDAANIILATQYTSIDLSSDNANWQIT
jgi:hypothetical protein